LLILRAAAPVRIITAGSFQKRDNFSTFTKWKQDHDGLAW